MNDPSFLYIPDAQEMGNALSRTTHLGIGAHPDDLEIMALHGILTCHEALDRWFGGITCTNGGGSIRQGEISALNRTQLISRRYQEQNEAALIGQYSFMAQLGLNSAEIRRDPQGTFAVHLKPLLMKIRPEVVYTHNPADKHPTHIAVLKAVLEVYRQLPKNLRPKQLLGCEVWRNLDWLSDQQKVVLSIDDPTSLAPKLMDVYHTQNSAGKQYKKAIEGRRRANATFYQTVNQDLAEQAIYAIDMTPLLENTSLDLQEFIRPFLDRFREEVLTGL